MSANKQYMKKMQAGLHWLRTYCKLSEEQCHAILNSAQEQVRWNSYIGDEEYDEKMQDFERRRSFFLIAFIILELARN